LELCSKTGMVPRQHTRLRGRMMDKSLYCLYCWSLWGWSLWGCSSTWYLCRAATV
jgi:hypothetical protein